MGLNDRHETRFWFCVAVYPCTMRIHIPTKLRSRNALCTKKPYAKTKEHAFIEQPIRPFVHCVHIPPVRSHCVWNMCASAHFEKYRNRIDHKQGAAQFNLIDKY